MNESLALRIAAIFEIFLASIAGICFPFIANSENADSPMFRCLKAGSAGVMLGLAVMHLLPDADELLTQLVPDYSLANLLTCVGVFFVLVMEQLTFIFARKPKKTSTDMLRDKLFQDMIDSEGAGSPNPMATSPTDSRNATISAEMARASESRSSESGIRRSSNNYEIRKQSKHREVSVISNVQEGELDLFVNVMNSNSLRDLVTAYVMEISIAVHSIIIGVDLGILGQGQITTLVSLMIALSFHQFVEGVGLGATIQNSRSSLGNTKVMGFIAIFSSTMPLGILIGILTSSAPESDMQTAFKGAANAIAAGSLLYISLTEMVGSYFNEPDLNDRALLKVGMMISFGLGIAFMAVIAVWA